MYANLVISHFITSQHLSFHFVKNKIFDNLRTTGLIFWAIRYAIQNWVTVRAVVCITLRTYHNEVSLQFPVLKILASIP